AALVFGYTALEMLLLAWLFGWSVHGATQWTFMVFGGLLAAVYNLFTCDWIAEKVAGVQRSEVRGQRSEVEVGVTHAVGQSENQRVRSGRADRLWLFRRGLARTPSRVGRSDGG